MKEKGLKEIFTESEKPSYVLQKLENFVGHKLTEAPAHISGVDYCLHMGVLAKNEGKNPLVVASEVEKKLKEKKSDLVKEISAKGPYVNISVEMGKFGKDVIAEISEMGKDYGKENIGMGKVVVVDMSSPNIAKMMSYAHLRSTIIGDALANIYRAEGYKVIRDNHIGDWGNQFGNLIAAIKKWGNIESILSSREPIATLNALYVKFHKEADLQAQPLVDTLREKVDKEGMNSISGLNTLVERKIRDIAKEEKIPLEEVDREEVIRKCLREMVDTPLEEEGRHEFLKLEEKDPENRKLWELTVELSLKEFNEIYKDLGVFFEETLGESFYEGMLKDVVNDVRRVGRVEDGALVVDFPEQKLESAYVQRSDGASLYITRDIAAAIYRQNYFGADKVIYVVGEDQKTHFKQLFAILTKLGYAIGENCVHVHFGRVNTPEGKMSTREGRVILLKKVLKEGKKRAEAIFKSKNPEAYGNPKLRKKIVHAIAVGAIKWNDLSYTPTRSFVFDWDQALNLEGYSAPYVQYAAVRAKSILGKAGNVGKFPERVAFNDPNEAKLIKKLAGYPFVLREALETSDPSKVANYVYGLAQTFNEFYGKVPVLTEENKVKNSRLKLVSASLSVMTNALGILGIEIPEAM
ncbi:arginine--tRNA ligase [Candidatus Woesebacteria bacterium]|nr:arginine--tRNA ligase [Candidatus Woesebacteria bacterium]